MIKRTPQEIMSENVAKEKALKELDKQLGAPRVKRIALEEYQAKLQVEKEAAVGGWHNESESFFQALWKGDGNE